MTIAFDLENIRKRFGCTVYFETGLWDPTSEVSSKKALRGGFDKVYCIELREKWIDLGKQVFKDEIESGRYKLISDDSSNMKNHLDESVQMNKTMFFLDAHVDNNNIHNYKKLCPLIDELDAIKSLPRNDNIILIDDLRIIKMPFPWGEDSYGNINFFQEIVNKILEINPAYKFTTLNGHVEDDVLLAYIE
jgi:hypothetical protein